MLIVILVLFQTIMLSGLYELKSSTVRKSAPWFYPTFLKLVGEYPSARLAAAPQGAESAEEKSGPSAMATVAGFKPEEFDITIENVESPILEPAEEAATVIPVSQPEEPEPVDENIPVG
ncbi:hypothetical protein P4C99_10525 [Pontiellaceae bacterium B1224]|nr:hypothetical protein [Pontiellaceae bacterium B1224]